MRRTDVVLAVLLLVLAAAVLSPRATHRSPPPAPKVARETAETPHAATWAAHPEIGFGHRERLDEHFRKHGREFAVPDAGAYLALAQALRDRPAAGDVLEAARRDRVITRFDRANGAFIAFEPDLTIRTFFKPNDGEAYFRRQLTREQ